MINKGQITADELRIQGLLDKVLKINSVRDNYKQGESHLDEDSLNAFVEGRIGEKESPSIVKHLIDCSFCRHITGELTKLNDVFAEDEIVVASSIKEPTKVSEVLSGLLSRLFGSSEAAVFAHQEEKSKEEEKEKDENFS